MKLPRRIRKMLGLTVSRQKDRAETLAKIERLGFQVEDLSGYHNGSFATRRYRLVDPSGTVLDNHGNGYASSTEAYRAALAAYRRPSEG